MIELKCQIPEALERTGRKNSAVERQGIIPAVFERQGSNKSVIIRQGEIPPVQSITGRLVRDITKGVYDISEAQDGSLIARVVQTVGGETELRITGTGLPPEDTGGNPVSMPWESDGYSNEITRFYVADGVTQLPIGCAIRLRNLRHVRLPDSLERIPTRCFAGGTYYNQLEYIKIPKSVTIISQYAFSNCPNLKKVEFNENLKGIGINAFEQWKHLEYIEFPSSLSSIGRMCFYNRYYSASVMRIFIPKSVTHIQGVTLGVEDYQKKSSIVGWCNDVEIYCEADKKPSGWNNNWNWSNPINGTNEFPVTWGVTREEFREIVRQAKE